MSSLLFFKSCLISSLLGYLSQLVNNIKMALVSSFDHCNFPDLMEDGGLSGMVWTNAAVLMEEVSSGSSSGSTVERC